MFVKFFNLFLKKGNKINPLIGNAGVSAVPDSARICQTTGYSTFFQKINEEKHTQQRQTRRNQEACKQQTHDGEDYFFISKVDVLLFAKKGVFFLC